MGKISLLNIFVRISLCAEKILYTTGQVRTKPLDSPSTVGERCSTAGGVENLQSPTPDTNIGIEMVSQGGLLPTKQSFRFLYDVGAWSILEDGNFLKLTSRQEK